MKITNQYSHKPVMLNEVLQNLLHQSRGVRYLDCTFGRGGHSKSILKNISEDSSLIALDIDNDSINIGHELMESDNRFSIYKSNFRYLSDIFFKYKMDLFDGILFDLGVSSEQLDNHLKGFSFHVDGPLDMRMDQHQILTAEDIVNKENLQSLTNIFRRYGEAKHAFRIAKSIIEYRSKKRITSTLELVKIIKKNLPVVELVKKKHPCRVYFQALRIATNKELDNIKIALNNIGQIMNNNARLVIITFHSLEENVLKAWMKNNVGEINQINTHVSLKKEFELLHSKPLIPSEEEIKDNSRCRSSKLWVFKKWR